MIDLLFDDISNELRKFTFPEVDLVVGIAKGGVVPASLIAHQLPCPLQIITIHYRDRDNAPFYECPQLIQDLGECKPEGKRILLVDDVSVSGQTMELAKSLLTGNQITSFTLKGDADLVLYPELTSCVNWPWKVPLKITSHEGSS